MTQSPTIRTTAHPVILSSRFAYNLDERQNTIIAAARDVTDGDLFYWSTELLYATQMLRMAYDSPRIGGGIDPELATNLPDMESAREDCYVLGYIIGSETCDEENYDPERMGILEGVNGDKVQDMIVHAEAVAVRLIAWCKSTGQDY